MHGKPASPWWRPWTSAGTPSEAAPPAERPSDDDGLRARVVERAHRCRARTHGQRHGGSPGMAGRTVEARAPQRKEHGPRVKQALRAGTSQPQPGTRGDVPQPPGGLRTLGVPTGVDRCIQPAVRQGLQAHGDPPVSAARVGFRPGRRAHHAITRAPASRTAGATWVGAMALETCVDRVNHDPGRRAVSTRVRDRRVLTLIHRVLKAGARAHEARPETVDGGPHGGPRSP